MYDTLLDCIPSWPSVPMNMRKAEFDTRIYAHERWLKGDKDGKRLNIRGRKILPCKIGNSDLRYATFTSCDLSGVTFSQCYMQNTLFKNSRIVLADFLACDLTTSSFIQVDLSGTDFSESDLTNSIWDHVMVYGIHLDGTNLTAMQIIRCAGVLRDNIQDVTEIRDSKVIYSQILMPKEKGREDGNNISNTYPRIQCK